MSLAIMLKVGLRMMKGTDIQVNILKPIFISVVP